MKNIEELYEELLNSVGTKTKTEIKEIITELKNLINMSDEPNYIEISLLESLEYLCTQEHYIDNLTILNKLALNIIFTDYFYQRVDNPLLVTKIYLESRG